MSSAQGIIDHFAGIACIDLKNCRTTDVYPAIQGGQDIEIHIESDISGKNTIFYDRTSGYIEGDETS